MLLTLTLATKSVIGLFLSTLSSHYFGLKFVVTTDSGQLIKKDEIMFYISFQFTYSEHQHDERDFYTAYLH